MIRYRSFWVAFIEFVLKTANYAEAEETECLVFFPKYYTMRLELKLNEMT